MRTDYYLNTHTNCNHICVTMGQSRYTVMNHDKGRHLAKCTCRKIWNRPEKYYGTYNDLKVVYE